MKYNRILRAIHRMPWCILPEKLAEIVSVLQDRSLELKSAQEDDIPKEPRRPFRVQGDVAIIPIQGTIAPRMNLMTALSGGTSAEILRIQVQEAAEDPDINSILLDIDSPGGAAYGIPEAGDAVFAARSKKPVVALVNPIAASAAYWIASQASQIVSIPSGEAGSIGVIMLHQDLSKAFESAGVTNTLIKSSPFKGEGNPFEPLSDEDREEFQRVADLIGNDFHRAVARGRGLSVSAVRSEFGQGRMVLAKEAMAKRMIDRVENPDQTLTRLQSTRSRQSIAPRSRMTAREFETELRESLGFTAHDAKTIASSFDDVRDERIEELEGDVRDERTQSDDDVRDARISEDRLVFEALKEARDTLST